MGSASESTIKLAFGIGKKQFPLPKAQLVGGLEHEFYFSIYWEESSQLTFIFFRGVETINQLNVSQHAPTTGTCSN
jgi:hypothetical protein